MDKTANSTPLGMVEKIMLDRFAKGSGTPRSEAYKLGALFILDARIVGSHPGRMPYAIGSAEADAYFAGQVEGLALFLVHQAAGSNA